MIHFVVSQPCSVVVDCSQSSTLVSPTTSYHRLANAALSCHTHDRSEVQKQRRNLLGCRRDAHVFPALGVEVHVQVRVGTSNAQRRLRLGRYRRCEGRRWLRGHVLTAESGTDHIGHDWLNTMLTAGGPMG